MTNMIELAPHEALELHEIIHSEVTAVKKMQASLALVTDPDLKGIMEQAIQVKKNILNNYQTFCTTYTHQQ